MEQLLASDPLPAGPPWVAYRAKGGHEGPMAWEAKHAALSPRREGGDPGWPLHLLAARYARGRAGVEYVVSNAPPGTPVEAWLLVAFSRWRVERCLEDGKTELGFDHFEGRSYVGLLRHQRLVALAHLFRARARQRRGERSPGLTVCQVRSARSAPLEGAAANIRRARRRNAAARRWHTKETKKRLREAGIKLNSVRRCRWNSS